MLKGDREPPTCSFCFDLLPPAKTSQRQHGAAEDKRPPADAACRSTDDARCTDCQNMLHSHMSPKQSSQLARFEQMRLSARLHDLQTVGLHARPGADASGFGGTLDSSRARGAATEFADSPFLIRLRKFHMAQNEFERAAADEDQVHAGGEGDRGLAMAPASISSDSAIASVQSQVQPIAKSCANQSCEWYVYVYVRVCRDID